MISETFSIFLLASQAGTFRIRTELGDRCLTSEGSGSYMDIWDCYDKSDAPHQYWKQRNPNKESGSGANKVYENVTFN